MPSEGGGFRTLFASGELRLGTVEAVADELGADPKEVLGFNYQINKLNDSKVDIVTSPTSAENGQIPSLCRRFSDMNHAMGDRITGDEILTTLVFENVMITFRLEFNAVGDCISANQITGRRDQI